MGAGAPIGGGKVTEYECLGTGVKKIALLALFAAAAFCACGQDRYYALRWSDEFNGFSLDPKKWNIETGADGWGNNELQEYTRSGNIQVNGGCLRIIAKKEGKLIPAYTSARLDTKGLFSFTYGKIEARIRFPFGKGIWPAFWMLGANIDEDGYPACGEIDIAEMVGGNGALGSDWSDARIWGSLHRRRDDTDDVYSITAKYGIPGRFADAFHVFGVEWDEESVNYYVDGDLYLSVGTGSRSDGFDAFHKPFFIVINLAVGGDWPGNPDGTTQWPQEMDVDWVRVYR